MKLEPGLLISRLYPAGLNLRIIILIVAFRFHTAVPDQVIP